MKYIILPFALTLASCSTYSPVGSIEDGKGEGLSYGLPLTYLKAQKVVDADCKVKLSIIEGTTVADPSQRYVLQTHSSGWADDVFKLQTTEGGLLTSASNTSTGQAASILTDTIKFASGIYSGAASLAGGCAEETSFIEFDPAVSNDMVLLSKFLGESITVQMSGYTPQNTLPGNNARGVRNSMVDINGVLYRRKSPIRITVDCVQGTPREECISFSNVYQLPQFGEINSIALYASGLTTTSGAITMVNGYPTTYDANQPSKIASAAKVPLNVFKAILQGPIDLLTFRVKSEGDLYEQENAQRLLEFEKQKAEACLLSANEIEDAQTAIAARILCLGGELPG